jgi:ATP-dependent DNA helicase RecG
MKPVSQKRSVIPSEGETVELKRSLGEWKEIVETCAAFATAHGGRVYVGVADDGRVVGVQVGKGTFEDIANKIAQNTSPKIVPTIATRKEEDRTVVLVEVTESPTKPVMAFDRAWRRSGRTNQVLSASEIAELYLATRGVTWDQTVREEATVEDIDAEKVRRFLSRARRERQWEIDPETPMKRALRQLHLIQNDRLTIAALLLFGNNPQRFLVQAKVRCARFKGDDEGEFLDLKVIEGDVIAQVAEAMAFVRRNTSMAAKIEGKLERTERWEYPLDAVREAITNAVCHRDYASSGNVQVRIFDNSLVVSNPGCLPNGLTVEDLRRPHESKPRNKLIADAFFLIKYIEQFGTGTRRMIDDCQDAGIPEPEFESRGDSFRTIFRKAVPAGQRFAEAGLNERQLKALGFAAERGQITLADFAELVEAPKRTLQRDLQELVRKRFLVKHGSAKATWYEVGK